MKIVRNETETEIAGIGNVAFQPFQSMRGTYWHDQYGRTHQQGFRFTAQGREYFGTIIRTFNRDGKPGARTFFDVELMTLVPGKFTRHGRALPESQKADWRRALIRHFKAELERFNAARDLPELTQDNMGIEPAEESPAALPSDERARAVGRLRHVAPVAAVRRDNVEYHAGRNAWAANQTKGSNPYPAGGERAARWDLGWQESCDNSAPVGIPSAAELIRADAEALADILADWPTMRALSAHGAAIATEKRANARALVTNILATLERESN